MPGYRRQAAAVIGAGVVRAFISLAWRAGCVACGRLGQGGREAEALRRCLPKTISIWAECISAGVGGWLGWPGVLIPSLSIVPRLSVPDLSKLDPETVFLYQQLLRDYGPYGNMLSAFLPRPPALKHLFSYLVESKKEGLISPRHLEIALLAASKAHACHYCVTLHEPKLASQGISQQAIDRLLEPEVPGLDDQDLAVRDYAVAVTLDAARIGDGLFARLRRYYDEPAVVELTIRIALCSFFKRFNEALEVPSEDVVAFELPAA
ncbi:uncharacterized peroxidase-related enzyme [Bordetella avium]|nr:uncharacterized peroxidase-related enzyme [Bordetella avium]